MQVAALTSKAEGQVIELRQARQQLAGSRQQLDIAAARAATSQQQVGEFAYQFSPFRRFISSAMMTCTVGHLV